MVSIGHHHDLDNPNFSVMPDLIRHPENQLPESNWIPAPVSSPGTSFAGMTIQKNQ
jgi:hypothetical protein